MKKYFLLCCFIIQATLLFSQKWNKEPYLTKSLNNESIKNIEATTSGGSISVDGVASEARIEVYVESSNWNDKISKEELKQRLEELYDLNISVSNNKLTAVAKTKDRIKNWKKALSIGFKIYVPQNVSTDLTTSGGSISLSNLSGTQKFTTSGGSLHIDKLSGKVDGRTSGGSIHVQDSKDEIELTTSGGSILADNCSGNLRLTTSGGSLKLSNLNGTIKAITSGGTIKADDITGELSTHTSGGSIHLSDMKCSLEASTTGGSIHAEIAQLGKYARLSNSGGNIDITLPKSKGVDLDLSGRIGETNFENFDGKISENTVRGKLNGGGVPVKVDSNSGRIEVAFK
jgi:hypothetical protein